MILNSLLLICYVTLVLVAYSTTVQSRHIIQKRDSTPCTPQINNCTKSLLLQLDDKLENLKSSKSNIVGNLEDIAPNSTRREEINQYLVVTTNQSQCLGIDAALLFKMQKLSSWTDKLLEIFWKRDENDDDVECWSRRDASGNFSLTMNKTMLDTLDRFSNLILKSLCPAIQKNFLNVRLSRNCIGQSSTVLPSNTSEEDACIIYDCSFLENTLELVRRAQLETP